MTEGPAFLFIFLPRSISEQRGLGRSPSLALRAPDLSRPPYRSEHLQNRRPNAAPRIIKATIHLPAERGRGSRPGFRGMGVGATGKQTQPTPKSFEKPHSATPATVYRVGQEEETKKNDPRASAARGPARLLARRLLARPGSRPEIYFGEGG